MKPTHLLLATVLGAVVAAPTPAGAVPAFARKYQTSCQTCHTIFPKLNPFGEQFRRNGFRFPGIDSDNVKAEQVSLGAEEYKKMFPDAVWPATLTPFPPFALGLNGQMVIHPDRGSSAGAEDNGAVFNTDALVEEAHLWAAGSIDDAITFYSELTLSDEGVELEHGTLQFSDLVGPAHAVNVVAGKGMATLTSFGPHSTYVADMAMPHVGVTELYGADTESFVFNGHHNVVEVNGVLGCRFNYAFGLASGSNLDVRNSANFYAHAGVKLGGSTLDGEQTGDVPQDLAHEQSVTLDAFASRSISRFNDAADELTKDTALVFGGTLRAQAAELELDAGGFYQTDDHVVRGGPQVATFAQWDEASYLVYPWLAVAARFDFVRLDPDGGTAVNAFQITPGVAALIRPNLRLTVTMPIERASGAPDAGWEAAGFAAAPDTPTSTIGPEVEAIEVGLFSAF